MVKSAVPKDNTEYPEPDPRVVFPEYLGRDAAGNDVVVQNEDEKKERIGEVVQKPEAVSRLSPTERQQPPVPEDRPAPEPKAPVLKDPPKDPPKEEPKK